MTSFTYVLNGHLDNVERVLGVVSVNGWVIIANHLRNLWTQLLGTIAKIVRTSIDLSFPVLALFPGLYINRQFL